MRYRKRIPICEPPPAKPAGAIGMSVIAALIDQHGLPLLRFCQRSGLNINPGDEPDVGIRRLMTLLMYNGEDDLLAKLLATPAPACAAPTAIRCCWNF